jgi:VRR-NUC domain-containing protein
MMITGGGISSAKHLRITESRSIYCMHIFRNAHKKWWQKPLIETGRGVLPAELAILKLELGEAEDGVWINSRGTKTGVYDLEYIDGKFQTIRKELPELVTRFLVDTYKSKALAKGCPDLVIWDIESESFRFVEVKCPRWDRLGKEQIAFIAHAKEKGIGTTIAEWIFEEDSE